MQRTAVVRSSMWDSSVMLWVPWENGDIMISWTFNGDLPELSKNLAFGNSRFVWVGKIFR